MTQDTLKQLHSLAKRYKKYGITLLELAKILETRPEGMTERAASIGIRMSLARQFNETEYFTIDDITEITGETPEAVIKRIEAMGIDVMHITSTLPGLFS